MMRSSARGRADTNPRTPPVTRGGAGLGSRCPVRIVPRTPSDHRRLPRPQNPAGSAWRVVKVHNDPKAVVGDDPKVVSEVVKPRPKPSSDLGRDFPTRRRSADRFSSLSTAAGVTKGASRETLTGIPLRWSRGDSNPGPPPCKGGALPAKLRPPTAASPVSRISAAPLQTGRPDRTGWARLDSNQGPRPYQGRALTA